LVSIIHIFCFFVHWQGNDVAFEVKTKKKEEEEEEEEQ
jgi:hypothetical protein